MNPSFQCDNTVVRIRLDGNLSPFLTFRLDGIRFDGSESYWWIRKSRMKSAVSEVMKCG
jgi:hypothetical protein